ncbi:hypothetical protein SPSYN_02992 [Sporotomaculum syntrophicum]|uniref:Uncharacterized protein n=1 Tax=Sporotomaculum syntrophicum TaxID=182264 RepID=A0A9D2WN71_9FIRM|nr:hypothetical protein [Sporotomaculum syntrophicum]KAF1083836.1 hypothetical protein SPSYN_02992 [Sporotomaculum syntrophicum]
MSISNEQELLNPAQISQTLGINPINIIRLTREGYLEVKKQVSFKNGVMQLFNRTQVQTLIPAMPRIKQAWERYDNYHHGGNRMARARAYRHQSYRDKVNRKEQFFNSLNELTQERHEILKTAYYLYYLNHYAKAGSSYLYDLKETVLHTLVKNYYQRTDWLKISLIEGTNKIVLCPECRAKANNQRLSYLEYLDKTGGCNKCIKEYKYYSLYEFIICCQDYRFCFHTPYSTAKRWFNKQALPPCKECPEREGAYAFGRAIYDSEAKAVELIEVIDELQNFLALYNIEPLIDTY